MRMGERREREREEEEKNVTPNQISMSLLTYLPLGMPPFPTGAFVQLRISFPFPVCDGNTPFIKPADG